MEGWDGCGPVWPGGGKAKHADTGQWFESASVFVSVLLCVQDGHLDFHKAPELSKTVG